MTPFKIVPIVCLAEKEHIAWAQGLGATKEEAKKHWQEMQECVRYTNDEYIVLSRACPEDMNRHKVEGMMWLSVKRLDGEPVRNWRHLQEIKNHILGREAEAIELFPAESRKADTVNQYHLFGCAEKAFPIGFNK